MDSLKSCFLDVSFAQKCWTFLKHCIFVWRFRLRARHDVRMPIDSICFLKYTSLLHTGHFLKCANVQCSDVRTCACLPGTSLVMFPSFLGLPGMSKVEVPLIERENDCQQTSLGWPLLLHHKQLLLKAVRIKQLLKHVWQER